MNSMLSWLKIKKAREHENKRNIKKLSMNSMYSWLKKIPREHENTREIYTLYDLYALVVKK